MVCTVKSLAYSRRIKTRRVTGVSAIISAGIPNSLHHFISCQLRTGQRVTAQEMGSSATTLKISSLLKCNHCYSHTDSSKPCPGCKVGADTSGQSFAACLALPVQSMPSQPSSLSHIKCLVGAVLTNDGHPGESCPCKEEQ